MNRLNSIALCLALFSSAALAQQVSLIGVFQGKAAVLVIDGAEPKTVKVGQEFKGVKVIAVDREKATVIIDGKQRVLPITQHHQGSPGPSSSRQTVVLAADPRGHFVVDGQVNGGSMRFLVDTGATGVALPAADAQRLGIDYRKGARVFAQTANGTATAFRIRLDSVKVGDIEITNVDGVVIEQGLQFGLLGMTFLNRVDMLREGDSLTLKRRF